MRRVQSKGGYSPLTNVGISFDYGPPCSQPSAQDDRGDRQNREDRQNRDSLLNNCHSEELCDEESHFTQCIPPAK
jgi:hypothetical protein